MTKVLMALAIAFAVQTPAQAQLGGLMKKAKKVAEQTVKQAAGAEQGSGSATQNAAEQTQMEQVQNRNDKSHPEVTERKNAEAGSKYVQDIVNKNYLLDELTDKNRQAKAVADYKAKVNAKVNADLAPTKILGTYSTSVAWQGLPVFQMPELKDKYSSVQEMQFKTFYEKDGKYYVVKSAFRQSIPKVNPKDIGAQPQPDYWPGLETSVEIPVDKIQGKF